MWRLAHRADPFARDIADRHYNRQKVGTPQFVPPGRCLVLTASAPSGKALWVTSWPFAEYVKHAWPGAWVCSAFRNEGAGLASALISEAISATKARWPDVPDLGMITFLNPSKVRPVKVRGVETWGRTWTLCGFERVQDTAGGLMAFQLLPENMPDACPAQGTQSSLFAA